MNRGRGICDSHCQRKWQQVWARQVGKQPASAPPWHREAVEQTQSSPCLWDGGERLMGLSSHASLVAVFLPKPWQAGTASASSPAGPFPIGCKCFEPLHTQCKLALYLKPSQGLSENSPHAPPAQPSVALCSCSLPGLIPMPCQLSGPAVCSGGGRSQRGLAMRADRWE